MESEKILLNPSLKLILAPVLVTISIIFPLPLAFEYNSIYFEEDFLFTFRSIIVISMVTLGYVPYLTLSIYLFFFGKLNHWCNDD
jgi:hypothetical protein